MGSFRIPIVAAGGLESMFVSMPDPVKAFAREGFDLLAGLDDTRFTAFASLIKEEIGSSVQIDPEALREKLGISARKARTLSMIASIAAVVVTSSDSSEKAIDAAQAAGVLPPESAAAFDRLVEELRPQEEALRESIRSSELASEVLPSFLDIDTTVDLRLGFDREKVNASIPIVAAHLRTDARDSHVWFQMQKRDVVRLISEFEKLLRQLEEAERWAAR